MCGRYSYTEALDPVKVISPDADELQSGESGFKPRYNIAPSQYCPIIPMDDPDHIYLYRWGLIPFWAKDMRIGYKMINARAETLLEKSSFKKPVQKSRCLVLADGFYEWKKVGSTKQPHRITLKDGVAFYFAGLTERWKSPEGKWIHSFTIITTEPNELVSELHNRMPVILESAHIEQWLQAQTDIAEIMDLLRPYPAKQMRSYEVSPEVGNVKNDYPELVEPLHKP